MSYEFYKVLHLSSLGFLLISTSAMVFNLMLGNSHVANPKKKMLSMIHGIVLLVALVSGFGLLARLSLHGMPGWIIVKLGIFAAFGALPVVLKKMPSKASLVWFGIGILFSAAATLAILKPF